MFVNSSSSQPDKISFLLLLSFSLSAISLFFLSSFFARRTRAHCIWLFFHLPACARPSPSYRFFFLSTELLHSRFSFFPIFRSIPIPPALLRHPVFIFSTDRARLFIPVSPFSSGSFFLFQCAAPTRDRERSVTRFSYCALLARTCTAARLSLFFLLFLYPIFPLVFLNLPIYTPSRIFSLYA